VIAPRHLWLILSVSASLTLAQGGRADPQIVAASPFLPPSAAGVPSGAGGPAELELRGILRSAEGARFWVYDTARKSGTWAELDQHGGPFVITSADLSNDAVTVFSNGKSMRLVLRETGVAHMGTLAAPGPLVAQGGEAYDPVAADQAQRMQAAAEEVRMRRVLREQAALEQGAIRAAQQATAQ
jgi:hypothetical protein